MEQSCSFEVAIAAEDIAAFSRLTGDWNPLHNDPEYARTTEFGRPIGHGAFLVGLVSRALGMHVPGKRCLILTMRVQFPKPVFFPTQVRVDGQLKSFSPEHGNTGVVRVTITDLSRLWTVLEAEVTFSLHAINESIGSDVQVTHAIGVPSNDGKGPPKRLLITGGTGGLGATICPALAIQFPLVCLTRRSMLKHAEPAIEYRQVDLEAVGAFEEFLAKTPPDSFYGVVHLSTPPVPRGFVSDDLPSVRRHLRHAIEIPILLAKWARQPCSAVKRIIFLGSTFGTKYPKPALGAYSLAKASQEHLTRLLVSDMAAQGATVNAVLPTVVPVGLNEGMSERACKVLLGKMPTGRLVAGADIVNVLAFLLSDAAHQINGSTIAVDGGLIE